MATGPRISIPCGVPPGTQIARVGGVNQVAPGVAIRITPLAA
jgi:hypothetical protein